jgi:hypothetical protein
MTSPEELLDRARSDLASTLVLTEVAEDEIEQAQARHPSHGRRTGGGPDWDVLDLLDQLRTTVADWRGRAGLNGHRTLANAIRQVTSHTAAKSPAPPARHADTAGTAPRWKPGARQRTYQRDGDAIARRLDTDRDDHSR